MAVGIQNFNGTVTTPNSDYPSGNIKDDTGSLNGTDIDVKSNGDIHQTLAKLLRLSSITPSGLPDNEYSGFQYVEAMIGLFGDGRNKVFITGAISSTSVFSSTNDDVIVAKDAAAGQIVSMNICGAPLIGKIKIRNYSFSPVSAVSATGETINGAASPFSVPSRSVIDFTLSGSNWVVSERFIMP